MKLTEQEKVLIKQMKQDGHLRLEDENRSNYQYEVEKPSKNEYKVSKWAVMCLAVEYFDTANDVIHYIEK